MQYGRRRYKRPLLASCTPLINYVRSIRLAVAGVDLLWEKNTASWLVAGPDLVWEKNTANWLDDKPNE